jgi:DUF1707 SHOCT-like domain/Cell wall-active antibiotics response LiaF, C-terminal
MGDDASIRVSDDDRDRTVVMLREHLLAGRLTLDEFSERAGVALGARTAGELARVQEDLPAVSSGGSRLRRNPARFTAALLGHVTRRGRLRLRRWSLAASALGDLDFDLREAVIDQPQATVTVLVAFGNADIYVPEGISVDVSGMTVFGHRREWGRDLGRPDAPAVHVRVFGCFGTVDVWRVPPGMRGSYGEIFRQLEERQRQLPGDDPSVALEPGHADPSSADDRAVELCREVQSGQLACVTDGERRKQASR